MTSSPRQSYIYLHEEAVYVGALSVFLLDLPAVPLGHLAGEAHLVQRQLVLPGRALHDRCEEGLRVEEARQPNRGGKVEVIGPSFPA